MARQGKHEGIAFSWECGLHCRRTASKFQVPAPLLSQLPCQCKAKPTAAAVLAAAAAHAAFEDSFALFAGNGCPSIPETQA